MLVVYGSLYFVLGVYLEQIVPSEYGVAKSWYFPCIDLAHCLCGSTTGGGRGDADGRRSTRAKQHQAFSASLNSAITPTGMQVHGGGGGSDGENSEGRPASARRRRNTEKKRFEAVEAPLEAQGPAVCISQLHKEWPGADGRPPVVAVKSVDLALYEGQLFSLLGHNGAGKTSLISMLTGLHTPSSGDATVFGASIVDQMPAVRNNLGICPQVRPSLGWKDGRVDGWL